MSEDKVATRGVADTDWDQMGSPRLLDGMESTTAEVRLLLACARVSPTEVDDAAIRHMLGEGVDWTSFARKAIGHGLPGLVGHILARFASDMVPDEILEALGTVIEQTRRRNLALLDELARIVDALARQSIDTIPLKGPAFAVQAYGDLGLRAFNDLDFLVRDRDLHRTVETLKNLGFARERQLTDVQLEFIHRIQGYETFAKPPLGLAKPHTRLTSAAMAFAIDYAGLWRRALSTDFDGRTFLALAPEDCLIVLAMDGGKSLWRSLKWLADLGAFVAAQPRLDWNAAMERAGTWGCRRMLLLATALARRYVGAAVPEGIAAAAAADRAIEPTIQRITAQWTAGEQANRISSVETLRLHDGTLRKASHLVRASFLPQPHHVAKVSLPRAMRFAYVPIRLAQDGIVLPLAEARRQIGTRAQRMRDALARSHFAHALMPATAETRLYQKSRAISDRILAKNPNDGAAWYSRGSALLKLGRYKQAIESFDKALALAPDKASIWKERSLAMAAIGRREELRDTAFHAGDANAWAVQATRLSDAKRFAEASEASDRALAIDPENIAAMRTGIFARLHSCDWSRRDDDERQISEGVRAGRRILSPFFHRTVSDSEAESLSLTRLFTSEYPPFDTPLWQGERYRHDKIRVAYVSTDFREHVVADAIVGVFEHHDKARFETTAISLGPNDGSDMRRRMEAAFDHFVDAQAMSDEKAAEAIREREIDIAVDLNGHAGAKRIDIFARRPAPVQVNYLGYPGTMAVAAIDYIIADRLVIPDENCPYYDENVVYLPQTYFPTDGRRRIGDRTPSRAEAGLPETGFVFACHSAAYKLSPQTFDVWMKLLLSVEGSVLWLRALDPAAMVNLGRAARARGVAPTRLIFAPRLEREQDHLARLRLADLFLDTLPFNAHGTASDALWVGLPVVTCPGKSFAGRVAASLLNAIGLPELVAGSLAEYEHMARALAQNPERLAALKAKLLRNRETKPLFDTASFTRDLESAFSTMWSRTERGQSPERFSVTSTRRSAEVLSA